MALEQRLKLQAILELVLGTDSVYFQPPPKIQMSYPAIVYTLDNVDTRYADNNPYSTSKRYQVTVIDRNPDSVIPDKVAKLPMSSFSRHFVADNLNQYVYTLYF